MCKKYSKYEVHTDCELPISVAWHDGNTKLFSMRCRRDLIKRIRRQTVEHRFGTIKARMGATHFLTRTIERVSTEMSLHVLAYNMKPSQYCRCDLTLGSPQSKSRDLRQDRFR
jgi:hypothetical protein